MADELERHGRYGDTQLVHLNPIEVRGLESLSPTGKLTINPITGKKEAFLPLLIPLIASYGGSALAASAGASAIGAAIAGGAASGLATYATTGDADRALMSGVMGMGMGAATAGAAGAAGAMTAEELAAQEAIRTATEQATTQATAQATTQGLTGGADLMGAGVIGPPAPPPVAPTPVSQPTDLMGANVMGPPDLRAASLAPPITDPNPATMNLPEEGNSFTRIFKNYDAPPSDASFGERMAAPLNAPEGEGMMTQIMKPSRAMPMMMGAGQLMEMDQQDGLDAEGRRIKKENEAKRRNAYNTLQGAYRMGQPNAQSGMSSYRNQMSYNTPPPNYAAAGGLMSLKRMAMGGPATGRGGRYREDNTNPYETNPNLNFGVLNTNSYDFGSGSSTGGRVGNSPTGYGNPAYGGIDPVTIQAGLRGRQSIAPGPNYMAGMNPEFMYFQDDMENIQVPRMFTQAELSAPYNTSINRFRETPAGQNKPYFSSILPQNSSKDDENNKIQGMAEGGDVTLNTPLGSPSIAGGGIASVPNEYTNPSQAQPTAEPTQDDITLLASALMGENEHADQIVEAFVKQYGPEKFMEIRQKILQMIQPNAQTEGMVRGQGGGMDDQVEGTIGGQQPVAVSPGEYIVPADVVSGLGDGSSDAGAEELDKMQQNVRMARGGGTTQPPPVNARKLMPY